MNNILSKNAYTRVLLRFVLFAVGGLLLYLFAPKVIQLILPFLFAFIIASMLQPVIKKKSGVSRKLLALLLTLTVYIVLLTAVGGFFYTLVSQAVSLAENALPIWNYTVSVLSIIPEKLDWLLDYLPNDFEMMVSGIINGISEQLQTASSSFINTVFTKTVSYTSAIGRFVLDFVICIMATYFFTVEYNKICETVKNHTGARSYQYFCIFRTAFKSAVGGYIKAQLLLALSAFIVMFAALGVYGQEYAFLISLFLGFVDFLPIVGTAAVLVPWGLLHIIGGDIAKGIFLLGLCMAFFIIRKIIEPKIVGSQTGLHPLLALFSIYVGMKVAGVWGAVLGPIVFMIGINIIKSGIFHQTILDIKTIANDISGVLGMG